MARYIKKGIKDPRFQYPNRYILSQIVGTQYDIIPYKGTKGVADAQPINEANMADIEDALVNIDTDLAFIEADYINAAEHALKQDKTDNALTTSNKTVVGAINELVTEKQDKTDNNLDTSDKTVVGAINEVVSEKQDKTDNALNTTNKTVVGAINEVKSDSEYYDAVQDDAIAIINNKVNALPMNGSLKNIRTSTVGIPTTLTNIDMFNTKQTVTNYQPLSLDYKGAAEPHVVVMKTIGDYIFDFAIEAAHTNGTDTTITLEAWVDGVLYDTATRTLVGGSNQVNGITGFFSYSKGTDTVPSEIYFKFKASQGNTSANKAMINTNLQGNSATMSFTDTDHVTGVGLNEVTYNGATTSFIINDLDTRVDTKVNKSGDTMTGGLSFGSNVGSSPTDVTKQLTIHDAGSLGKYGIGVTADNMNYVAPNSGQKHNFLVNGITRATIAESVLQPKDLVTKEYGDSSYLSIDGGEVTGSLTIPHTTKVHGASDGKSYMIFTDADNVTEHGHVGKVWEDADTNTMALSSSSGDVMLKPATGIARVGTNEIYHAGNSNKIKQDWSLNDLNLDGTWSSTDIVANIMAAYNKVVSYIGTGLGFTLSQGFWNAPEGQHYEFSTAIRNSIINEYGFDIGTVFDFSIRFSEINGMTIPTDQISNYITIKTSTRSFTRQFQSDNWAASKWLDENGAPHCDVMVGVGSYMTNTAGHNINAPMRGYISGITFWIADYQGSGSGWSSGDHRVHYVPRSKTSDTLGETTTEPPYDTLFTGFLSFVGSLVSTANPLTNINQLANMYLSMDYAVSGDTYPNGIRMTGALETSNSDQVLAAIAIHYGKIDWDNVNNHLPTVSRASFTPALLELPTISDNMELPQVETPNIEPGNE